MKKIITAMFIIGLVLTTAELIYVHSTPLAGEGNLEDMMSGNRFDNMSHVAYTKLYLNRPHVGDPYLPLYKMMLVGWWVTDSMVVGVDLWQTGMFSSCVADLENISQKERAEIWLKNTPDATASQLYPPIDRHISIQMSDIKGYYGGQMGKEIAAMGLGWLVLGDLAPINSLFFLTDECQRLNSSRPTVADIAEVYRTYFARSSFVESAIDGGRPWKGIYYLSYYGGYNRTIIVVYGIPETELLNAEIVVDGDKPKTEIVHPFILADGHISEGNHTLRIATSREEYQMDFMVDYPKIRLMRAGSGLAGGSLTAVLYHLNDTIELRRVKAVLGEEAIERNLSAVMLPYNGTMIELNFTQSTEGGRMYDVDLMLEYGFEDGTYWFNRTLRMPEEISAESNQSASPADYESHLSSPLLSYLKPDA